ncbi:MAG: PAS domain S-box protein, partial [Candidatus Hodarchaeota archaeon]
LITENANDMIIVLDKKFRHEYVNPSYLDALGYSEEEALGKSTLDFVHPDDIASGVEGMKSSFTTGKGAGVFRLKRKDKGYLWTETSGRTFLDSDGKSKVVLFSRDITKRKETEEKYRIVSEHVRDLITIVNDKGTYEYVNYAHLEIMGYKPEDLVGKSMFDIAHPRDIPTATRALVDLVTGKSEDRFQLRVKKKNGEYMWIESGGAVFTDNQGKNKFVFISTDITKRKEMEDRIKESEEKYRLITENANDLIVLLDDQFNVEYMNETITRLQGWNQDEILGISVLKFLHPDDVERATKEYMTGLTMGEGVGEFRLLHMDGYYTWFEIRGKTFQDSEGKTKAVLFARDISKRKETELKLKDSEQLYKSLIENISDTILKLSFTGKILYVSPQVEELGYNPKELIYKNGFSLIHPDDIEKVTNVIYKSYTAKESQTVEFRFKRKNEDYTTVSARGLASEDETLPEDHADKITWTCILRDITARILIDEERKKLYKQIQTLNLELEGKIKERTKELQEAMINAEAANRAKSVFLATMSHELRTPLNSVIAFSEGLLEGFVGDISGKQREYITDIFESGQHLLTLINDILDLSKIEAGRMEFNMEEFSVADLVEKSVSLFKEKSFRHNIAVNVNVSEDIGTLVADERKIKQVLFNLLSNAFKFTADDGNVGIDVEKSGNEIHFSVWDTGIGIAKEDLPKLFQPFSKLDVSIEIKGTTTGLGLYYSRKLVEIHGGTIWVDSRPGIGSRFTFSIPTGEE